MQGTRYFDCRNVIICKYDGRKKTLEVLLYMIVLVQYSICFHKISNTGVNLSFPFLSFSVNILFVIVITLFFDDVIELAGLAQLVRASVS